MYWIFAGIALSAFIYYCLIKPITYWSRKGVPQKSVVEELVNLVRTTLQLDAPAEIIRKFYNDYPGKRYNGTYQFFSPVLYLRDPELIKQITVKDFDHFVDHGQFMPEDLEPLWGKNLFALKGDKWRDMRATLSPSFTNSKMRLMFSLMNDCAKQFVNYFKNKQETQVVEMKDAFTRYTNDVIATTAFGISCDSLKNQNEEFYMMGKEATDLRGFWKNIKLFIMIASPTLTKFLGLQIFSDRVSRFFRNLVRTNIQLREKNNIVRHDMIHLLMEARKGRLKHEDTNEVEDSGFAVIEESAVGKDKQRRKLQLSDDDLTAQVLVFFFAGFDTASTLMCFLMYEMAVNPDIQDRLRKEIDEVMESTSGSLTYESVLKMKYMDMVVSESLRKWPPAASIDRVCVKPYTIQPVKPGERPIHLQKDDMVWLPIFAIHRNPEFYSDPERFDPERFNDENKVKINPYTFLSFGVGPRSCIGNRFALLETKTIVFHILANFEILVSEKTTVPLKLATDQFDPTSANGYWVALKPRQI